MVQSLVASANNPSDAAQSASAQPSIPPSLSRQPPAIAFGRVIKPHSAGAVKAEGEPARSAFVSNVRGAVALANVRAMSRGNPTCCDVPFISVSLLACVPSDDGSILSRSPSGALRPGSQPDEPATNSNLASAKDTLDVPLGILEGPMETQDGAIPRIRIRGSSPLSVLSEIQKSFEFLNWKVR
jgi:hypothetical protein